MFRNFRVMRFGIVSKHSLQARLICLERLGDGVSGIPLSIFSSSERFPPITGCSVTVIQWY